MNTESVAIHMQAKNSNLQITSPFYFVFSDQKDCKTNLSLFSVTSQHTHICP